MSGIGGIVLAAGSSRRFGDDKRKMALPSGETVIEASINNAVAALDKVLVVLRHGDQAYAASLAERITSDKVTYFRAPDSALGMAHSLANAVHEVHDWDAAVVLLADMPFIKPETITKVIETYRKHEANAPIVYPELDGEPGHPVLFPHAYFDEIEKLVGDRGAKAVVEEHENKVISVVVDDEGILRDIDKPEDLAS